MKTESPYTNYILVTHFETAPKVNGYVQSTKHSTLSKMITEKIATKAQIMIRKEWAKTTKQQFILIVEDGNARRGHNRYDIHLHQFKMPKKETEKKLREVTDKVFKEIMV